MIMFILLFLVLVPLTARALHRDLRRADRRRRIRALTAPLRRDVEAFRMAISEAFEPALRQAVEAVRQLTDAYLEATRTERRP